MPRGVEGTLVWVDPSFGNAVGEDFTVCVTFKSGRRRRAARVGDSKRKATPAVVKKTTHVWIELVLYDVYHLNHF